MKKYNFTLRFKDDIGYFSKNQLIDNIKNQLYSGFVFGQNIKKKNIKVDGKTAHVSVTLLYDTPVEKLENEVNYIIKGLKKQKYVFDRPSFISSNKIIKSKNNIKTNKIVRKNKSNTTKKNKLPSKKKKLSSMWKLW